MKVLLIEDDASVAEFVSAELGKKGHECQCARNGTEGLVAANTTRWDALIVDRMLPRLDGVSLIKNLRERGDLTPILILSALGEVDDRVKGLQTGADDYLVKPFSAEELMARLEAIHRRMAPLGADFRTTLEYQDLHLDLLKQEVIRAGTVISLQPREYRLLEYLMRHAGQIVTRGMLLEHVWGYHFDPQTNVIDVHISRLRQKIDRDFDCPLVHTVRGAGYRFGD